MKEMADNLEEAGGKKERKKRGRKPKTSVTAETSKEEHEAEWYSQDVIYLNICNLKRYSIPCVCLNYRFLYTEAFRNLAVWKVDFVCNSFARNGKKE